MIFFHDSLDLHLKKWCHKRNAFVHILRIQIDVISFFNRCKSYPYS